MNTNPAIIVEKLNVSFGDSHVVKDLSFSVASGESYGIVGESGSGKSTLIRCINGLEQHQEGRIAVNDTELDGSNRA
ncbi:ATP-binding cassette domain-containing protein, partial [Lysobacter sp. 2RAB21]